MPERPFLLLLIGAAMLLASPAHAERVAEAALREAIVVKLLMFVDWPEAPRGEQELRLCEMAGAIRGANGRMVRNRRLKVVEINRDLGELHRCDVFFADADSPRLVPAVAAVERKTALLVIAEGEQTIQQGATIALSRAGGRMVFDVNLAAARAASLTISSKLLRLARHVIE